MGRLFVMALLGAGMLAIPAQAQDLVFKTRAWELQTLEGRQLLLERLDRQVKRYCRVHDRQDLRRRIWARQCRMELLDEMVAGFRNTALDTQFKDGRPQVAAR